MWAFLSLNIIMIRLTENIKNDLARWDKLGYIIISASISTTETMPKLDADGNEIEGEVETDEDGEPIRYLTDQYIAAAEVIHGDGQGLDNGERTNKLKEKIKESGFSFKQVWGVYEGDSEKSFMIFPMKINGGEVELVDFDELVDFGRKLVGDFTQYSVHVHSPNTGSGEVTNDNYKGEHDDIFKNTRASTESDEYLTSTVNPKKPSALDHSFSTDFVDGGTHHELKKDHLTYESMFNARDFENVYREGFMKGSVDVYQIAKQRLGTNEWHSVDENGDGSTNAKPATYDSIDEAKSVMAKLQKKFPDIKFKIVTSNDEFVD